MALTILDPGMLTTATQWVAEQLSNKWTGDPSDFTDAAANQATIGTAHAVFSSPYVNNPSQNATGDNSQGLADPLRVTQPLIYTYTSGHATQHETR